MKSSFWILFVSCLIALIFSVIIGCDYENNDNIPTIPDIPHTPEVPVWELSIEKVKDVLQGWYQDVDLTIKLDSLEFGGFDLLIGYDARALAFTEAELGTWLHDCGWEYFTYRYNWNGDCGDDCPSGVIRLVGIAETNNGNHHPDYDCIAATGGGTLATLTFFVSNDRTLQCTRAPIQFYWLDCGDNALTVASGDSLFINRNIYDCNDSLIQDGASVLPGYTGAPDDPCMLGDKNIPVRYVDFHNGYIDIQCYGPIDGRGDINVNGLANEIADAVLFAHYFIEGTDVFHGHIEASTAASDVNEDGITLSLADFVYLIRVICGDALPDPPAPQAMANVYYSHGDLGLGCSVDLGAALFVFQMSGPAYPRPDLFADNMDIMYGGEGNELRILIYNIGHEYIPAGSHLILEVGSDAVLLSAETATYQGGMVETTIHIQ